MAGLAVDTPKDMDISLPTLAEPVVTELQSARPASQVTWRLQVIVPEMSLVQPVAAERAGVSPGGSVRAVIAVGVHQVQLSPRQKRMHRRFNF